TVLLSAFFLTFRGGVSIIARIIGALSSKTGSRRADLEAALVHPEYDKEVRIWRKQLERNRF
ncbi:MAG: hypothetical protein ACSW75_05530, partial [Lachnospiraceae bacterium]